MKIKTFVITGIIALGASFSLATTANADTHTVKSGECLWSIGQEYSQTPLQIVEQNPDKLSSINSIILPGEKLEVNESSYSYTPSTSSTGYTQNSSTSTNSKNGVSSTNSNNESSYSSTSGSTADQAAELMAEKTGTSASTWKTIIYRESGNSTTAQNSTSSAHGLFQVLGETSNNWETQVENAAKLYKTQGMSAWSETAY